MHVVRVILTSKIQFYLWGNIRQNKKTCVDVYLQFGLHVAMYVAAGLKYGHFNEVELISFHKDRLRCKK